MELIDGERRAEPLPVRSFGQPLVVTPSVLGEVPHARCRAGELFVRGRERVIFLDDGAIPAPNAKLVERVGSDTGHETLPDPVVASSHGSNRAVPGVEVADNRHVGGVRGGHGEGDAGRAVTDAQMSAASSVEALGSS